MTTTQSIIESLLFASDAPLTVERIQKVLPETDKETIKAALQEIKAEFDRREGGIRLREVRVSHIPLPVHLFHHGAPGYRTLCPGSVVYP